MNTESKPAPMPAPVPSARSLPMAMLQQAGATAVASWLAIDVATRLQAENETLRELIMRYLNALDTGAGADQSARADLQATIDQAENALRTAVGLPITVGFEA